MIREVIEGITRRRYGLADGRYLPAAGWPDAASVVPGASGAEALLLPDAVPDAGRLRLPLIGEQHFYGLGESAQQFDRLGAARRLWNSQGNHGSGADIAIPLLLSSAGYGLFFDSSSRAWITAGDSVGPGAAIEYAADAPGLDLYVITGRDLRQVLERATELLGRAPLPPRWALGFMQSSRFFGDTEELRGVLRRLRADRLPCDAFIFLSTYHHGQGWNRGVGHLQFNEALAPDPAALLAEMRGAGFRVFSHEYPTLHADSPLHAEAEANGYLLEYGYPDQRPHADGATNYREGQRFIDFSNPAARRWWWEAHRDLVALGIEGWWLDGGEGPPAGTALQGGSGLLLHNRYDLLRQQAFFEGEQRDRRGARPFLLCRSGGPGMQRFGAACWSGDINCTFETLEEQVAVGLNMGLSGVPFWGTDIGGFYQVGGANAELLVRWFQFGAFCPVFRLHGHSHRDHLPWSHGPAVEAVLRRYLELRSRLMPYTYTLAWQAHRTGLPLMRAMVLHDPADGRVRQMGTQYLWGDDLLVAPVTREAARHWTVYLPRGVWFDWWTHERHEGPAYVEVEAPLDRLPLFVRGGAVIPLGPVKQHDAEEPDDGALTLLLYPAHGERSTELYQDDGISQAYRDGSYDLTRFTARQDAGILTLSIDPPGSLVQTLLARATTPPTAMSVDGVPVAEWRHDDGFVTAALPAGAARIEITWT